MMKPDRRFLVPGDLVSDLKRTEKAIGAYADSVIGNSIVDITIKDCEYPFLNSFPRELEGVFDYADKLPKRVLSADLELLYDGDKQSYLPFDVKLLLDNDQTLIAHMLKGVQGHPQYPSGELYWFALMNPGGVLGSKEHTSYVLPRATIQNILTQVGVGLPEKSDQSDGWSAIEGMLQFAGEWTGDTCHSVPLDETRTMTVIDHVEGRGLATDSTFAPDDTKAMRKLKLNVDSSASLAERPEWSWQIYTSADNRVTARPKINNIQKVPLEYREPDPTIDDDVSYPNQLPIRVEKTSKATTLMPSREVFNVIRGAIAQARIVTDLRNPLP